MALTKLPQRLTARLGPGHVLTALRWEAALQIRHQIYSGTAMAAVLSLGFITLLPDAIVRERSALVPLVVLVNLQVTTFFFASALVTIDRAQGVIGALLTTPERVSRYLWVRALALSALGTGETAFIVFVAIGPDHEWRWFVAGAGLLSFIYALVGMAIVAKYAEFRSFLRSSPTWVFAFSLPLLGSVHLLPGWLFLWHPVKPALILVEGSTRAVASSAVVYGILAGIVSCSVAFRLAKSRLLALGSPESI